MIMFSVLSAAVSEGSGTGSWVPLAYLVSGVLFILALRGLSSPSTSRAGNRYGMIGMLIAVVTTLVTHEIAGLPEILGALAIGGGIGWITARRIQMTDMPISSGRQSRTICSVSSISSRISPG